MIISVFPDVRSSIAKVVLLRFFDTSWSNRETREGEVVPRRARHRPAVVSDITGAPAGTIKDKHYVLQIFIPIQRDYLKCPLNKVIRSHRAWPTRCPHARKHTCTLTYTWCHATAGKGSKSEERDPGKQSLAHALSLSPHSST